MMVLKKFAYLLMFLFCWFGFLPSATAAQGVNLHQSVKKTLGYSPQLQAVLHNHEAVHYDFKQARAGYFPTLNLSLGHGLEQFSDSYTRKHGADPSNTDWDSRTDAAISLIQKLYDGGETSRQVSIQKALMDSSFYQIQDVIQMITLNAINAHLEVYKQRQLVDLAKKNLKVHQDIYQSLAERERAGAGDIADVTQTQARVARTQSMVFIAKEHLTQAVANYVRVVGTRPGDLAGAGVPEKKMPGSLEEALSLVEKQNPELLALDAKIAEAKARIDLVRSNFKPKVNIELSSHYYNQLEGDDSWQNTNEAMLTLNWNLFNGGQDMAKKRAATSRKNETRSDRDEKLIELREAITASWANFLSLHSQKKAFQEVAIYSQRTFEAYLKQFSVSKRSLLDVLSAEDDYFQAASQVVVADADMTIAAYRILKLTGHLQIHGLVPDSKNSEDVRGFIHSQISKVTFLPDDETKTVR